MEKQELIDIPALVKKRLGKWSGVVPRFVVKYLERIVHVDEVNYILKTYGHLPGDEFLKAYMGYFDMKIETKGTELVPKGQRYIFAANHPLGSHDGVLMIQVVNEMFGTNGALVNDLLTEIKPLKEFFIPVNKIGKQSRDGLRQTEELFNSDKHVVMYPSGMVSRKINGVVTDLEWKKSVVSRAIRHKMPIVPIHISGRNSEFFYNFSKWRGRMGIKFPIEMLYLFDEMFNKKGDTLTYTFGKPIDYTVFDKSLSHANWAAKLRDHVYRLPEDPKVSFLE